MLVLYKNFSSILMLLGEDNGISDSGLRPEYKLE
jgi:hypothetical protein